MDQNQFVWLWLVLFYQIFPHPPVKGRNQMLLLFSRSVTFDSVWPRGLQYTRLPCPAPSPRVCSDCTSTGLMVPSNHLVLCCPSSPLDLSLYQYQGFSQWNSNVLILRNKAKMIPKSQWRSSFGLWALVSPSVSSRSTREHTDSNMCVTCSCAHTHVHKYLI